MHDKHANDNPYASPRQADAIPACLTNPVIGSDDVEITGLFSASDYKHAFRVFHGRTYWLRGGESVVLACAALASLKVGRGLLSPRLGPAFQQQGLILIGAFLAILGVLVTRVLRKQMRWRKTLGGQGAVRLRFTAAGVQVWADDLEQHVRWGLFACYRRDDDMLVLVLPNDTFMLAPRRFVTTGSWDTLIRIVDEKLRRA